MTWPLQVRSQREAIMVAAAIVFGVGLSTTWTILLTYAVARLIDLVI